MFTSTNSRDRFPFLRRGKTLRDYGEFTIHAVCWADPKRKGEPEWPDCRRDYRNRLGGILFGSKPAIESLRPYVAAGYAGWNMEAPDRYRADCFIKELKEFEKKESRPRRPMPRTTIRLSAGSSKA